MNKLVLSASMLLCCTYIGCGTGTGDNDKPATDEDTDAADTGDTNTGDTDSDDTDEADDTAPQDTDSGEDTAPAGDDTGATDTGPSDTATDTGATGDTGDTGSAANEIAGTYGPDAILPIQAAYWIGQPNDPTESGGGPFLYLFSAPVTCDDISQASWLDTIPAGTQVLEMIVGTTTPGASVAIARSAGADAAEVNYAIAGGGRETRADSGMVTLTALTPDTSVDGTLAVTFPEGSATGTFHATWCATGQEF